MLPTVCMGDPGFCALGPGVVGMGNPMYTICGRPAATVGMPFVGPLPGPILVGDPFFLVMGLPLASGVVPHGGGGSVSGVMPTHLS